MSKVIIILVISGLLGGVVYIFWSLNYGLMSPPLGAKPGCVPTGQVNSRKDLTASQLKCYEYKTEAECETLQVKTNASESGQVRTCAWVIPL